MKLIIIGNGFDLHHGLKTSFSDFRNYLSNSDSDTKLLKNVDFILGKQDNDSLNNLQWNDFEDIMGGHFTNGINKSSGDLNYYEVSTQFTERFYSYLIDENEKRKIRLTNSIKKEFKNANCILTFNYTNT